MPSLGVRSWATRRFLRIAWTAGRICTGRHAGLGLRRGTCLSLCFLSFLRTVFLSLILLVLPSFRLWPFPFATTYMTFPSPSSFRRFKKGSSHFIHSLFLTLFVPDQELPGFLATKPNPQVDWNLFGLAGVVGVRKPICSYVEVLVKCCTRVIWSLQRFDISNVMSETYNMN